MMRRLALLTALGLLSAAFAADLFDLPHEPAPWEVNATSSRTFTVTDPPPGELRPVAEWEPARGALVRYQSGLGIPWALAAELAEDDELITLVSGSSQQTSAETAYAAHGVNLDHCRFIIAATNSMWTRDYGPFFVMSDSVGLAVIDFPYNRPRPLDDEIPITYAAWDTLALYGMNLTHTGGNWMTDGYNTAAGSELVWDENTGYTHAQIADLAHSYTGAGSYLVLPDPLGEYIEHIDCWGKFLSPDKVLIGRVPETDDRYADYEAVAAAFAAATCAWGTPYRVYRVDTPGSSPYTPYTNSLILNGKVYVPLTGHTLDAAAIAAYRQAMPGYEVLGYAYSGWLNTDALHCRVHELPDKRMLELRPTPLIGMQPAQDSLFIRARVRAHSGAALLADSLCVHWRVLPDTLWATLPLEQTAADSFAVWLPPVLAEATVQYWLSAADTGGRAVRQPLMGPLDPHTFTTAFTALDAPEEPAITVQGSQVCLTWQPVAGATGYKVWSAGDANAESWSLEAEVTETQVLLPADEEMRVYRITAVR